MDRSPRAARSRIPAVPKPEAEAAGSTAHILLPIPPARMAMHETVSSGRALKVRHALRSKSRGLSAIRGPGADSIRRLAAGAGDDKHTSACLSSHADASKED